MEPNVQYLNFDGIYIYESPDGNTVTRRPFMGDVDEREIIFENGKEVEPKPFYKWQIKLNEHD